MKIKLIPRFSFTLHLWMYFRFLFSNSLNKVTLFKNRGKIYFTNYARASLYLLLKSISSKQLIVGVQAFTCHSVFKAIKKYQLTTPWFEGLKNISCDGDVPELKWADIQRVNGFQLSKPLPTPKIFQKTQESLKQVLEVLSSS